MDKHNSARRTLSPLEREVLTIAQLRAGEDITKLAKLCKRRAHQVRYALTRLTAEGLIRPLVSLNFHALGWLSGSVHFSTSSSRPLSPGDIVRHLHHMKHVTYVSCFSTEPQYEVSFAVSSLSAMQTFTDTLTEKLPLAEKVITLRMEGVLSGRKYLSTNACPGIPILNRPPERLAEIDAIDKKLLQLLVHEPSASMAKIAGSAGLPETSARLRIRKLEKKKVIAGYRYHFQNDLLPVLDFKILVYTGAGSNKFRRKFEAFADGHKNVVYRSTCLGPWEFELDVEVEFPHEVAALCHEIRGKFPNEVTRIQTLPRFYSQSFLNQMFP